MVCIWIKFLIFCLARCFGMGEFLVEAKKAVFDVLVLAGASFSISQVKKKILLLLLLLLLYNGSITDIEHCTNYTAFGLSKIHEVR